MLSLCHAENRSLAHTSRFPAQSASGKILSDLGLTATQAVNMFFAQIERRKGIPFPVTNDPTDILPPIEHLAAIWDKLDNEDFSHLDKR